jgi:hypothetical protein
MTTWSEETTSTASWADLSASSPTWTQIDVFGVVNGYLQLEYGDYLLKEDGGKITISETTSSDTVWTIQTPN